VREQLLERGVAHVRDGVELGDVLEEIVVVAGEDAVGAGAVLGDVLGGRASSPTGPSSVA
jgi:hypothetical protein